MIFVVTEKDGIVGPIQSWNATHLKSPIQKIFLTDGKELYEELKGYDSYYADKEAISRAKYSGGIKTALVKESIYGIRDLTKCRQEVFHQYNQQLKHIMETHKEGDLTKRLKICKEKYDELIEKLNMCEIDCISISFTHTRQSIKTFPIDHKNIKDGQKNRYLAQTFLGKGYHKRLRI